MQLTKLLTVTDNDKLCKEHQKRKFFSSLQNNNILNTFNPL